LCRDRRLSVVERGVEAGDLRKIGAPCASVIWTCGFASISSKLPWQTGSSALPLAAKTENFRLDEPALTTRMTFMIPRLS
jgi:hypothetical protein